MQQRWESSYFWVPYAARKNFAFELVFWKKLDGRFFGTIDLIMAILTDNRSSQS